MTRAPALLVRAVIGMAVCALLAGCAVPQGGREPARAPGFVIPALS